MGTEGDKRRAILLCACIACILIGLSFFVLDPLSLRQEKEKPSLPVSQAEEGKKGKILVYVVGAVKNTGVYVITEGRKNKKKVKAAGDVLPYADMTAVNMAEPVTESMKIWIPLDPYMKDPGALGLVNFNTAGAKELDTLPGIGKVTAENIMAYREEYGSFRTKKTFVRNYRD